MGKPTSTWMRISACPPVRISLDALGVTVEPFCLFLEKQAFADLSHLRARFADYEICLLGSEDMPEIATIPERSISESDYQKRLRKGHVCCGAKHRSEIVAFTWADMKRCDAVLKPFTLKQEEAYLYDAFTRTPYRGKGLAAYLRWWSYGELARRGKLDLYSFSQYFNTPAIRFKRKLNATIICLGLYVCILNRFSLRLFLKKGSVPF
jgi:hypothetical protein